MPVCRDAHARLTDRAYHRAATRLARGRQSQAVGLHFDAEHSTHFMRTAPGPGTGCFVSCWVWVPEDDVTKEERDGA